MKIKYLSDQLAKLSHSGVLFKSPQITCFEAFYSSLESPKWQLNEKGLGKFETTHEK